MGFSKASGSPQMWVQVHVLTFTRWLRKYLCHSWCSYRGLRRCSPDRCGDRRSTGSRLQNAPSDTGGHIGHHRRSCRWEEEGVNRRTLFSCLLTRKHWSCRPRVHCAARVFGVQVFVHHHDLVQLVQSSLSGPVHCRHVASHRWQFPCGLKYSPADGEQHKSPLKSSFMTISNENPVLQGRMAHLYCP